MVLLQFQRTSMVMEAGFTPGALTVRLVLPGVSAALRMAVAAPEKSFMRGSSNESRHVGSPLAVARNSAAPLTLKLTIRVSSGTILPFLSATRMVT